MPPISACVAVGVCALLLPLYRLFFPETSKSGAKNSKSNSKIEQPSENSNVATSSEASESNPTQFDTVQDFSDHHYRNLGLVRNHQPPKAWTKKIMEEWKILQENLPETIIVKAYESRMDLLRAAIIGADGTPYHDGIFFFDIMFPSSYPNEPPKVWYRSGGLRLKPNLYSNGTVCLSLLGTWRGSGNERWLPDKSTMLQVLLSIQALILNSKPFFNEPVAGWLFWGRIGATASKKYNENIFILSTRTMVYSINNPPKHFEDIVTDHFRARGLDILKACRAYSEGTEVGSDIRKIGKIKGSSSPEFKASLAQVVELLTKALTKNDQRNRSTIPRSLI